jgi:ornithine cyclodeaminase
MAIIIDENVTRKLINMPRAIKLVEDIFRDRAAGKVRSFPRLRLKGSEKQLNVMAAWQQTSDLICLRSYAGEANTVTLYNGRTGRIQAIVNMAYLSSLRTGAASGVAARYLAPANSPVMGLIGPGWQATFQVEAIAHSCPVRQILVFGRDPKKARKFISAMRKSVQAEWKEAAAVEEVEAGSDIFVLATDSSAPVAFGTKLKDEVLVISMGANQPVKHEVSVELVRNMDLIVTDDLATAQNDSGDLIAACGAGILRWDDVVPLEKIVVGEMAEDRPKKILFQSNGIADEDLAVGRYVFEQVKKKRIKARKISEI